MLRAAADAAEDNNIIVIGSQAILGTYSEDELPLEACLSIEVDIAFLDDPDEMKATKVDGAIGEDSRFHETFGIYGQGVGLAVADLPSGWLERCVPVTLQAAYPSTAVCLEAHDIVVAKLSAGRREGLRLRTGAHQSRHGVVRHPARTQRHSSTPSRPSAAGSWRRSTGSSRADRSPSPSHVDPRSSSMLGRCPHDPDFGPSPGGCLHLVSTLIVLLLKLLLNSRQLGPIRSVPVGRHPH